MASKNFLNRRSSFLGIPSDRLHWVTTYLWASLIFLFSTTPTVPSELSGGYSQEIFHFFAYAILSTLLMRTLKFEKIKKAHIVALAATIVFGVCMELLQIYVPGRNFDFYDIAVNAAGATLGSLL